MQKHRQTYIAAMMPVAISMPPKPPEARPMFQPEYSPAITAPTPSAQRVKRPAWRWSLRFSK
jgi:hypothetical protein